MNVGGLIAVIAAKRARKEGRKPYPTNKKDWLKFFIVLVICLVFSFLFFIR